MEYHRIEFDSIIEFNSFSTLNFMEIRDDKNKLTKSIEVTVGKLKK